VLVQVIRCFDPEEYREYLQMYLLQDERLP
jgi:hypothetical protein